MYGKTENVLKIAQEVRLSRVYFNFWHPGTDAGKAEDKPSFVLQNSKLKIGQKVRFLTRYP